MDNWFIVYDRVAFDSSPSDVDPNFKWIVLMIIKMLVVSLLVPTSTHQFHMVKVLILSWKSD